MANQQHLNILKQGMKKWNKWREHHPDLRPDLSDADLSRANLEGFDLRKAILCRANLRFADLRGALLRDADLSRADLSFAHIEGTDLRDASLNEATLCQTKFSGATLSGVDFSGANLTGADLRAAVFIQTNLRKAILTNCHVYGAAVWDVDLAGTEQFSLIITDPNSDESVITVDDLEVAQFIYLLLSNQKIRDVIETITSKVVLILGRFSPERKVVLDALRDELRRHNYTPVLFDFERPASRDFTETVRTLAHLARFILADLTEPSSIPQELQTIVPDLEVPVQPLLLEEKRAYAMFVDFRKYDWVLPTYLYKDQESLIASLQDEIIDPADKKARELALEKAKRLEKN